MFSPKRFHLLTFVLILVASQALFAQGFVLKGVVSDKNTHQHIRSVNIFVRDAKTGTTTDLSGRYSLSIAADQEEQSVVFQHIAYYEREIPATDLRTMGRIFLQPRVIPLSSVEIEEEGLRMEIQKDLPQSVSVIESRDFEIRGYVDAGDLLRIDNSVQIDEEISGVKTISIRGGNPDEVMILYNGVKMNNALNNVFDLSLIDLEDVERFELIKGSNTALYGPEAFSGAVNVVPKVEQDYTLRFQQRLGTYRSGNWGLHFYKRFNHLYGGYSLKRGGLSRDILNNGGELDNGSLHHTATLNYDFGANEVGRPKGTLSGMWVYSSLDFDRVDREPEAFTRSVNTFNHLLSLRYSGELLGQKNIDFTASFKNLDDDEINLDQRGVSSTDILDRAWLLNAQKQFQTGEVDAWVSYQFERSTLDREISRVRRDDLRRLHHGFAAILKYHGDAGSDFLQTMDVDVSLRHDRVQDRQDDMEFFGDNAGFGIFSDNDWNATNFKFALNLTGYRENLSFSSYLNFGANTKFPTLFQQISSAAAFLDPATAPNLEPEKNRSFEFGVGVGKDMREHTSIYGWELTGSYFQNHYDNKFREFSLPIDPRSFYDNVPTAKISGFEGNANVFLYKKKVSVGAGYSKYFITDKAVFPFKSDVKRTLTINVDHAGYGLQLFWFHEGDQIGLLRTTGTTAARGEPFSRVTLPDWTNLDVHFSKRFEIAGVKLFGNASGRNLLNDEDIVLEGIAIRDRRYYLTLGVQY